MMRAAFATLCSVSKMMVSKYEASGLVVVNGKDVDAALSLENLEGRLDEHKRQRALATLKGMNSEVGAPESAGTPTATGAVKAPSAKLQKDEVDLQLKRLDYGERAGELVAVEDVTEAGRQAVAAMRETFNNSKRDIAKKLCAKFDLAADKETALTRFLSEEFERAIGRFGELAAALAKEPLIMPQGLPVPDGNVQSELQL